jgi:hypothetical protein
VAARRFLGSESGGLRHALQADISIHRFEIAVSDSFFSECPISRFVWFREEIAGAGSRCAFPRPAANYAGIDPV